MESALITEFRAGFYPNRPAAWIESVTDESDDVTADIAGCLHALAAGQRDFAYPRHDEAVFDLLQEIVPSRALRLGADIGCATGCFPAMQLAAGIERCTVFEVRAVEVNDDRVDVRLKDLTYADDIVPEFDLVTCLSTIEHVGLGRYGDRLDPWGDVKMAANLRRLVRPGGILFISFPVGRGCVVYNQHRIYSRERRAALFGDFKLIARHAGRSPLGQMRYRARAAVSRAGVSSQPVYVLEKPA